MRRPGTPGEGGSGRIGGREAARQDDARYARVVGQGHSSVSLGAVLTVVIRWQGRLCPCTLHKSVCDDLSCARKRTVPGMLWCRRRQQSRRAFRRTCCSGESTIPWLAKASIAIDPFLSLSLSLFPPQVGPVPPPPPASSSRCVCLGRECASERASVGKVDRDRETAPVNSPAAAAPGPGGEGGGRCGYRCLFEHC